MSYPIMPKEMLYSIAYQSDRTSSAVLEIRQNSTIKGLRVYAGPVAITETGNDSSGGLGRGRSKKKTALPGLARDCLDTTLSFAQRPKSRAVKSALSFFHVHDTFYDCCAAGKEVSRPPNHHHAHPSKHSWLVVGRAPTSAWYGAAVRGC